MFDCIPAQGQIGPGMFPGLSLGQLLLYKDTFVAFYFRLALHPSTLVHDTGKTEVRADSQLLFLKVAIVLGSRHENSK